MIDKMNQFIDELLSNGQISAVLVAPIVLVFVGAILVFVFGFKKPTEPQFRKLTAADGVRRSKRKDKIQKVVTQNGVLAMGQEKSRKKDVTPLKNTSSGKREKVVGVKKEDANSINSSDNKKSAVVVKKQSTSIKKDKQSETKDSAVVDNSGEWMVVTKDRKKKIEQSITSKLNEKPTKLGKRTKKDIPVTPVHVEENSSQEIKANTIVETSNIMQEVSNEEIPQKPSAISPPVPDNIIVKGKSNSDPGDSSQQVNNVIFDELADAWTEAKAPRKTKKKSRKE